MSGEPMAYNTIKKIISSLNYLFREKALFDNKSQVSSCNALIQQHFDYGCTAWYPNLGKKIEK